MNGDRGMKAEEKRADYLAIPDAKNVGWVRPQAVTHQTQTVGYAALTHPTVLGKVYQLFGGEGSALIEQLNESLAA